MRVYFWHPIFGFNPAFVYICLHYFIHVYFAFPNFFLFFFFVSPLLMPVVIPKLTLKAQQTIQQMHRDHVPSVPPTFHLLGSTNVSLNQGMVRFAPSSSNPNVTSPQSPNTSVQPTPLPPIQILTIQGHPEFSSSVISSIIEQRVASGTIGVPAAEDANRRLAEKTPKANDALGLFGRAMWGLILGEM
jgi:hypothetical protein